MKSQIEWQKSIEQEIKNNPNKKIVLIAGASSSGKSYSSKLLCEYLNSKGIKSFVFTADNYYKGLSKILVEKIFINYPNLKKYEKEKDKIIWLVKSVIMNAPSTEKFCIENQNKIYDGLYKYISKKDAESMLLALNDEFEKINFDEPFALQLDKLTKDINSLINNEDIILPKYSFETSEVEYNENNKLSAKQYDVFIIEGLYVLRNEVYGSLNKENVIPCLIDCDIKTLLSRRLNRDIKSGRTTFSPEQTITTSLSKTMPSYFLHIKPYNKNSQFTLTNTLSHEEILTKENNSQIKFKINKIQEKALKNLILSEKNNETQIDYYFNVKESDNKFILRLREIDGLATKLTFKNTTQDHSNINRKIEEYSLEDFSKENRNIETFLSNLLSSGFNLDKIITKKRTVGKYKNANVKIDNVEKLGTFVEFDNLDENVKNLIKILKLKNLCNTPYIDLCSEKIQSEEQEKEYKFLINKIPNNIKNKSEITQFYLDYEKSKNVISKIMSNYNLQTITSARVRTIAKDNNTKYFLTLKSDGNFARDEFEIEISKSLAELLIKESANSYVSKTRYILYKNNLKFEFDKYSNNLCIAEIEVKKKNELKNIIRTFKELNLKFNDVTNNQTYKNVNLAKPIIK